MSRKNVGSDEPCWDEVRQNQPDVASGARQCFVVSNCQIFLGLCVILVQEFEDAEVVVIGNLLRARETIEWR